MRSQAIRQKTAFISELQEQPWQARSAMHSEKERFSSIDTKKARVTIEDSDNSGDESNVLVEEVNTASNTVKEVYQQDDPYL